MLIGVVLAGGLSTRMGRDKALLNLAESGWSLLEQAKKLLLELECDQVLVSSNHLPNALVDIVPQCGPLSGIHASFHYVKQQKTLNCEFMFVAIDMPNMTVEVLKKILVMGRVSRTPFCYRHHYLPLYMPYHESTIRHIDNVLTIKDNTSLRQMLKSLGAEQSVCDDNNVLLNINHPEQWENFTKQDTSGQ
jgi:molybdopterin-guanine dinucleotide biosynthesis protein A